MEFSEIFRFLIILKDSLILFTKNFKFMATITIASLILPSILVLVFAYPLQFLIKDFTSTSPNILSIFAILAIEIAFIVAHVKISHLAGTSTTLVLSQSGKKLSLQDLFSDIKRTRKGVQSPAFRSKQYFLMFIIEMAAVVLVIFHPNCFTISLLIFLGIALFVYQIYLSVAWALSSVVCVVEEDCQGEEALERAELLVKGQRFHGFMLNLFFNLLVLISFVVDWKMFVVEEYLKMALFMVNFSSLLRILISMAYTVYYFQCKQVFEDFQYSKLPVV